MNEFISSEMVNTLFTVVVIPFLGILVKYAVAFLKVKAEEAKQSANNNSFNRYILIAEDALETAVSVVSQTYVDSLKKEGSFDVNAQLEAFNLAREKAVGIMGGNVKKMLQYIYEDLDMWIDSKIEYYVNKQKG